MNARNRNACSIKNEFVVATTIKEIAKIAGVSAATVSRSLSGKAGMSNETRERILKICNLLNYHPNLSARSLVTKKTDVFEIVIPQTEGFAFSNPFYAEVMKGIGEKARESKQYFITSFARGSSYTRIYQHGLVGGIIVLANRIDDPRLEEACQMKVPMVLIPGCRDRKDIPSVDVDNVGGAFMAVNHLADLGHKRIAFLNGPMNSKYSIERLTGYRNALKKNGLPFEEELVFGFDLTPEGGYRVMMKALSIPIPPTAAFVMHDHSTMGVLLAAKKMGFRVPEDISIVGFGDVPFAAMTDPPLTTIKEPFRKLGYEAAEILLKLIHKKNLGKQHIVLPVELVVRESSAPPPKGSKRKIAYWQKLGYKKAKTRMDWR